MPSSREIEAALRRIGFEIDPRRGKGSHKMAFFRREGKIVIAFPFPGSGDVAAGTLASIRRSLKLTAQEFKSLIIGELSRASYERLLSERLTTDSGDSS